MHAAELSPGARPRARREHLRPQCVGKAGRVGLSYGSLNHSRISVDSIGHISLSRFRAQPRPVGKEAMGKESPSANDSATAKTNQKSQALPLQASPNRPSSGLGPPRASFCSKTNFSKKKEKEKRFVSDIFIDIHTSMSRIGCK